MRYLMWFTIGFGAACALSAYLLGAVPMVILGAAAFLAGMGLVLQLRHKKLCLLAGCILLGMGFGAAWSCGYSALTLSHVASYDGAVEQLTITTSDYSYETAYGTGVDGTVTLGDKTYRVRAYLDIPDILPPGSTISGQFRLRYSGTGGAKEPTYHRGEGIFLLSYGDGIPHVELPSQRSWKYLPAYMHKGLLELIRSAFPEDTAEFACALLLGESSGLDYETDTAFKLSGIRHIVAVSGLHVSILFSMVHIFGKNRYVSAILGIPVLLVFSAMAGFSPSILRACVMQLMMLLAGLIHREYDSPTALATAVLGMLLSNPLSVTSVGFQLSVASVAGILLLYAPIRDWMLSSKKKGKREKKGLFYRFKVFCASSAAVSLSAMIFTTPLTAAYFSMVSLVAPLTNLLTLWVVTGIFIAIVVTCVLSAIYMPLGLLAGEVVSWPIRYVIGTAKLLSQVPCGAVYTQSPYIVFWLILVYVLLAAFLMGERRRVRLFAGCAAVSLLAAVLASWAEPLAVDYRITVLDVGQGQCILLQSDGKSFMVDCGGSDARDTADLASATLLSQGIHQLDGMILTHYDADHVGSAEMVLTRLDCDNLYLPACEDTDNTAGNLPPGTRVDKLTSLEWENSRLTIFPAAPGKSDNESSLCVLFQTEKCDILITGDRTATGELSLLATGLIPQVDVLVAGHHGAGDSTGTPLLRGVRPETVVISVEADNPYGHPSPSLLHRLAEFGCIVRRTDLEGTIVLRG